MSTFQPLIPTGLVDLDVDYANIQGNFQQLDTSFAVNHTAFSVTPFNGMHTKVDFVNQSVDPLPPASTDTMYTKVVGSTGEFFIIRPGGSPIQLTNGNPLIPPNNFNQGVTFLPTAYSRIYSIQATGTSLGTTNTATVVSPSTSGFVIHTSSGADPVFWMAIGKT